MAAVSVSDGSRTEIRMLVISPIFVTRKLRFMRRLASRFQHFNGASLPDSILRGGKTWGIFRRSTLYLPSDPFLIRDGSRFLQGVPLRNSTHYGWKSAGLCEYCLGGIQGALDHRNEERWNAEHDAER